MYIFELIFFPFHKDVLYKSSVYDQSFCHLSLLTQRLTHYIKLKHI